MLLQPLLLQKRFFDGRASVTNALVKKYSAKDVPSNNAPGI
jgi:hypothetical protein